MNPNLSGNSSVTTSYNRNLAMLSGVQERIQHLTELQEQDRLPPEAQGKLGALRYQQDRLQERLRALTPAVTREE